MVPASPLHSSSRAHLMQPLCANDNNSDFPDSYLFSPYFMPEDDMLTLDAREDHWQVHSWDVAMQQQLLAEAADIQHSRFSGMHTLHQARQKFRGASQQNQVKDVLTTIQLELSQKATVNSKLQRGIRDSFEALGAYMRGMPYLHHAHRKQQGLHEGAPCMGQGPILQQHEGVDMAGGFAVPACDERPGNMTQQDFSRYLSPKLHALQQLRLDPYSPFAIHPPELPTAGLDKLQHLLSNVQEPALRSQLDRALHQLHEEYQLKHDISLRLWSGLLSLGFRLQAYITSTLVLRWHTRWLAGEQMDQPAEWLYNTLKLAANPSACVSYQVWLHTQAPGTNTPTGNPTAPPAKSTSCFGKPPAVHASLCIASGPAACHFMWFTAPLSHAEDAPGVHKIILGGGSSFSTPAGSPDKASHNMARSPNLSQSNPQAASTPANLQSAVSTTTSPSVPKKQATPDSKRKSGGKRKSPHKAQAVEGPGQRAQVSEVPISASQLGSRSITAGHVNTEGEDNHTNKAASNDNNDTSKSKPAAAGSTCTPAASQIVKSAGGSYAAAAAAAVGRPAAAASKRSPRRISADTPTAAATGSINSSNQRSCVVKGTRSLSFSGRADIPRAGSANSYRSRTSDAGNVSSILARYRPASRSAGELVDGTVLKGAAAADALQQQLASTTDSF